jgi:hypothetical protein
MTMTAGHMQWSCLLHIALLMVMTVGRCIADDHACFTLRCCCSWLYHIALLMAMTAGHMHWSCLLHIAAANGHDCCTGLLHTAHSYDPGIVHCNGHDWCSTVVIAVHTLPASQVHITLLTSLVGVHVALKIIMAAACGAPLTVSTAHFFGS